MMTAKIRGLDLRSQIFASVIFVSTALLLSACGGGSSGTSAQSPVAATAVSFTNNQPASVVIGQANFTSSLCNQGAGGAANTICGSNGNPFVNAGALYAPDNGNGRALVFNSIPTANNASASLAIGEPNLTTITSVIGNPPTVTASNFNLPQQTVVYNGKLLVADTASSRIAIFNSIPSSSPGTINVAIGQTSTSSYSTGCTQSLFNYPETVAMAGGKVVVTDSANHRVLIWNSVPTTSGVAADLVLGQANFTTCTANRGGAVAANTMDYPAGVWSDGTRLVVADKINNRLLIWNTFPTSNGQAADTVLGQPTMTSNTANNGGISASSLSAPYDGVYFDAATGQLFVADSGNNRVLVWNSFPITNGKAADVVLGQANFTSNTGVTTQSGLSGPGGVFLSGKQLFVADTYNNRYLIFNGQ